MKGTDQPIWILVAILLALVVGVAMYQLMGKANVDKFGPIMDSTDEGMARVGVEGFCRNWYESRWATTPNAERISDYAARMGWLSKEEWTNYAKFTSCDCAIYLYTASESRMTRSEVQQVYNSQACHTYANKQAIAKGLTG